MGVSLNGGTPISHPQVLIIFARENPWVCWVPPWPQLAFPGAASKLLPPKPPAGAACKSVVSCITWQVELSFELGKVGTGPPNHPIFLIGFFHYKPSVLGCFPMVGNKQCGLQ